MRLGFIGSGDISHFHIPALINNKFSISAIGSRPNSIKCLKLAEKYQLSNQYCKGGWEEVLSYDIDAIMICVEVKACLKILKAALDKGKKVFVEKPVNFELKNLNKIKNHKNIKNVFVGYNRRFYQTTNELKILCSKSSGGTITVNIPDSGYGIQHIIGNGCHMIDLLRYLVGDFKIVNNIVAENKEKSDINYFSALCRNQKWTILINAHSMKPSNFSISINSDKNVYELKPIEKLSIYEGMNIIEPSKKLPLRQYIPNLKYSLFENSKFKPGFDNMHKNFRLFINNEKSNVCSFQDSYDTLKCCWDLIKSDASKNFKFK